MWWQNVTYSAEISHVEEVSLFPEFSSSQSLFNNSIATENNLFIFAHARASITSHDLTFEVQPEFRSVLGSTALTNNSLSSIVAPARLMNLNWTLGSNQNAETILGFERLNLKYHFQNNDVSVGRKPVSLGVLSVFPVWNKFTRPLMTTYGPLIVFSQDQASFHSQINDVSVQALDIEQNSSGNNSARLGELAWYGDGLEIHVLGGSWWQSSALGVAGAGDLGGTSIRLEEISFSADGIQLGVGAERAFNEFWSVLSEFLYLQTGATDKSQYFSMLPSMFRPLTAKDYGYLRAEYKPWPLWAFQLGDLYNFVDSSQLLNGKIIYSSSDNSELNLEVRLPMGADFTELSPKTLSTQVIGEYKVSF